MKKSLKTVLLCLCLTAMSGCAGSSAATTAAASASTEASAAATDVPTIVRTSISSEPDSLDPWQSAATDTEAVFLNVFEGLLSFDTNGSLQPGLAESYEISEDGLTYTFHLWQNVTFHNGKSFTSADVLYTYNNLTGMNGEKAVSSKFDDIASIAAPDDYTFVITLKQPSAAFLSLNIVPILPEGYDNQAVSPVGTGPYKFQEYIPGQKIVLVKNEDYYNEDKMASIDTAEIYIMTDSSAVVSALQSGQLDFASISAEDASILQDDFTISSNPQNMVQVFALNNSVAPLDDVRVRQAINYAVDKQEIVDGAFDGYATILYSNFSPVMQEYYNDELSDVYPHDVEKARELLKEAGYENGFTLTIRVPANYTKHVTTAEIIKEQLAEVGITVEIDAIEWATWLDEVYTNAQYEGTIIGLTGKLDPSSVLGRYASDYPKNFFRFSNAEYDEKVAAAALEMDQAKRIQLYKDCQAILTEQAAAVYICDPNSIVAIRKDLQGYQAYPIGFIDLAHLYYAAE